jgi:ribonuclease Z
MTKRGKIAILGAALAAAVGLGVLLDWTLSQPGVLHRLAVSQADRVTAKLARNRAMIDESSLRVLLCGTSSPLANAERAGPCAAIVVGGDIWLVDAGGGSWKNLMLWQIPGERVRGVLLTHFHSDHIQDLGEVNMQSWASGRPAPLEVIGGPGVADVADGFAAAYALDRGYRIAHHGTEVMVPSAYPMLTKTLAASDGKPLGEGETALAFERNGLKVTAIGVPHEPVAPAYAFRFDYRGRSVVVSGDTRFSPALARAASGADVILHEAQAQDMVGILGREMAAAGNDRLAHVFADIPSYHTSPAEAAQVANAAGAKLLVLTHLTPPMPHWLGERVFVGQTRAVRPSGTVLGKDGMLITLPANASTIDLGSVR